MRKIITEIIGWYGVLAILVAYAGVSFGWLEGETLIFQLLNGTGAIGITYISFKKKAYQPALLNMVWTLIAIAAIIGMLA